MVDNKYLNIKQWAEEDRPREKMTLKGAASLSNAELLAILIGSGTREESAVDLSMKILKSVNNNLNALGRMTGKELQRIKGIGEAKSITIMAALELGRRRKLEDAQEKKKITCSSDLFDYFHPILSDLNHEEFWIMYLNRAHSIIDVSQLSSGGLAGTVIDVRIIYKRALELLSTAIILCHNHPSGNGEPSKADKDITKKIKNAGEVFDILVIDHIIIYDQTYFSFADNGLL